MNVEAKLAPQFTTFNPETLAALETRVLMDENDRDYRSAFIYQTTLVQQQFGLVYEAAERVVAHSRPDRSQPPVLEGLPGYYSQLAQETGLGFSVNPDFLLAEEPTRESLAGIFSAVYGVEPEKLYPAMEARLAAMKCLERNVLKVAEIYYKENMVNSYTLLKAAIS